MTSPLITGCVSGLHRRLPGARAEEAAAGLLETYEHHLATGASDHEAARAALAEFGDLTLVVGEFTARTLPGLAIPLRPRHDLLAARGRELSPGTQKGRPRHESVLAVTSIGSRPDQATGAGSGLPMRVPRLASASGLAR
jgi:hypothetical protein